MYYTHVVFDTDNTLTDIAGAVPHGLQRALRDIAGEHWDISRLLPALGIPGLDTFEHLDIYSSDQIFRAYPRREQYEQEYQYTAYLYEDTAPLLDLLKKEGYNLGTITPKTIPQYICSFLLFQISRHFQIVIMADDTVRRKPDPGPMFEYMKHTDACPRQTLYIGDSTYDMQRVSRAGAGSYLALWGCHCSDDISSTHRFEGPATITRQLK